MTLFDVLLNLAMILSGGIVMTMHWTSSRPFLALVMSTLSKGAALFIIVTAGARLLAHFGGIQL